MTISQVDRLGERLRKGSTDRDALISLAEYRNGFVSPTGTIAESIELATRSLRVKVSQRPSKSTPSIVAKLQRERSRLSKMRDIGGVRAVVTRTSDQDRVVDIVTELFPNHRIIDRRASPKYGYRAVHVVVEESGHSVEVQVRTHLQNVWAQASESLADRFGQEVKYGARPEVTRPLLDLGEMSSLIELNELQLDEIRRLAVLPIWRSRPNRIVSPQDRSAYEDYLQMRSRNRTLKERIEQVLQRIAELR